MSTNDPMFSMKELFALGLRSVEIPLGHVSRKVCLGRVDEPAWRSPSASMRILCSKQFLDCAEEQERPLKQNRLAAEDSGEV
jgi:hypothetical protein